MHSAHSIFSASKFWHSEARLTSASVVKPQKETLILRYSKKNKFETNNDAS